MKNVSIIFIGLLVFAACKKTPPTVVDEPIVLTPYEIEYPNYVPTMEVPQDNPPTVEGIALGRKLYYDPLLSQGGPNNGRACASCHLQQYGFTTPGTKFPPVLPHVNLGWHTYYLWDGRKQGALEDVMLFEVSEFFQADLSLFNTDETYRKLFKKIFGDEHITYERMAKMMAQFLRTVNSFDARFDKAMQGDIFLTDSELRGYEIFNSEKGDCFHCHAIGLFADDQFHNTGMEANPSGKDVGLYNVTGDMHDLGKFKTPTLRNAALRGPYMHDGRFATLDEVIEFYNSQVQFSSTLDPIMTKPGKENGLNLTAQDKADLISFLEALTDSTFISNPALSHP